MAFAPPRAKLLISLPVEQQLLELKPSGSKFGNWDFRPRWDAREWSVDGPIPLDYFAQR